MSASGGGISRSLREPTGLQLCLIVLVLALANFLAILDLTIASVLVPHIAGSLASSPSSGTWVITSYGVAEAIMVPLTGWLAERFGPVRVFVVGIAGFAIFSLLCGMATSLGMLIAFRIVLGICGGPLIPISQTLLLKIVPDRHATVALAVWSMTTVIAPIAGPVLGGVINDSVGWPMAFYFKVPLAAALAFAAWRLLTPHEQPTIKTPVDYVGLSLLIVWVGSLQVMLGNGQEMDWFSSDFIVMLLIVTVVGFVSFVIWELTDDNPIVNLRVFQNRAFSVSMVVIGLSFGVLFGSLTLVPLWLQTSMSYTATWAGYNSAFNGVLFLVVAPITAYLMKSVDHRAIVMVGLLVGAWATLMRVFYNDQMTFVQLMWPQLIMGISMPLIVIPLMDMSVRSLAPKDIPSGAGQFNFIRTLASAVSTAVVISIWSDQISSSKAAIAGTLNNPTNIIDMMQAGGMSHEASLNFLDLMVQGQSVMVATNQTFAIVGVVMLLAAAIIWIAPRTSDASAPSNGVMH